MDKNRELLSQNDPEFYEALVGYSAERPAVEGASTDYRVLRLDGRPHAGVNQLPWDDVQPNWLPYVRVDDPAAVAAPLHLLRQVVGVDLGPRPGVGGEAVHDEEHVQVAALEEAGGREAPRAAAALPEPLEGRRAQRPGPGQLALQRRPRRPAP